MCKLSDNSTPKTTAIDDPLQAKWFFTEMVSAFIAFINMDPLYVLKTVLIALPFQRLARMPIPMLSNHSCAAGT